MATKNSSSSTSTSIFEHVLRQSTARHDHQPRPTTGSQAPPLRPLRDLHLQGGDSVKGHVTRPTEGSGSPPVRSPSPPPPAPAPAGTKK